MKLSSIKPNPANPRTIKDESFKKLCNSIEQFPKMMALRPMVIDADGVILGGNMRFKALQHLGFKEVPDEWVKRADELTEDERRRFIIADNVSGGDWDVEDLAANWDRDELDSWGLELDWGVEAKEGIYTTKIESPIYEPKEEKPKEIQLFDLGRYTQLIDKINNSDIGEELKIFLQLAATRHIVFDYGKIAEYYAHSDKGVQELMEESALIIIDYKKAIELGFVKLYETLETLAELDG